MNKIKKIAYGATSAALIAPAVAFAQWGEGIGEAESAGTPGGSIFEIIKGIMNWLLVLVGVIAIIGFVISGIMYLTAAGDEGRIETAKKAMINSIIGVIVALLGFVIVQAVDTMLGGTGANKF